MVTVRVSQAIEKSKASIDVVDLKALVVRENAGLAVDRGWM